MKLKQRWAALRVWTRLGVVEQLAVETARRFTTLAACSRCGSVLVHSHTANVEGERTAGGPRSLFCAWCWPIARSQGWRKVRKV